MDIQVIKYNCASILQAFCDGAYSIIVFAAGEKITKRGKEVKSKIEIIDPCRQAHIMEKEMQVVVLELLCIFYAVRGNINPCYVKTLGSEAFTMPAPSAGNIQHPVSG